MNRQLRKCTGWYHFVFLIFLLAVLSISIISCASHKDKSADSKTPTIKASQEEDTGGQEETGYTPEETVKKSPSAGGNKDGMEAIEQGGNSQGQTFRQSVNKLNTIDTGQNNALDETK